MKTVLDCGLALRPAEGEDMPYVADCIREMLVSSVPMAEASLADLWTGLTVAVAMDSLSSRRMEDEVFILYEGKRRTGMLWVGISRDQFNSEPVGYLLGIYVEPAMRGKGIGRELIGCAESWCSDRGLIAMQLEVGCANTAASELYRSAGYSVRSTVMSKTLR